jgi:alcohol-forming fatty acyl-CoA reductase
VSTLLAYSDRTGFIDEKMFESTHDWEADCKKIEQTHISEIPKHTGEIIHGFANVYSYTKRMAEELLCKNSKVPLTIIRPSIVAAAFKEPFPGWTDSLGLLGRFYAVAGLGVMRDFPVNPKLISDQIPVDYVSNQLLAAIPIFTWESKKTGKQFFLTHACSSSSNGVTWGETVSALQ